MSTTVDLDRYLQAIVGGDAQAFAHWMASAEPSIRASLRSMATKVDTEAVLQEALLRVWQVAPRFEPDGRENGLLRLGVRIARNLAISEMRKRRAEPTEDLEARIAQAEQVHLMRPSDPILRRVIDACRDKLPEKPKMALMERLRSAGGAPDETLAERLGMKKNTFLQNFTRARKFLAECLKKNGVDLESELA